MKLKELIKDLSYTLSENTDIDNEKILDTFFIMQIRNASAHQPRLAVACSQSKAK